MRWVEQKSVPKAKVQLVVTQKNHIFIKKFSSITQQQTKLKPPLLHKSFELPHTHTHTYIHFYTNSPHQAA